MAEIKPSPDVNIFAETSFRGKRVAFGIKTDDRRRHIYTLGKTGMGKTTLLENMIYNDVMTGKGLAVVDPHGDMAEKILTFIPSERVNDVIYFNPDDLDFPIAFNILENINPRYKHLVASGLVGIFKKMWEDSWGPRLEYILRNTVLALLDYPGSTLLGILRMLADKEYRSKVIDSIQDPIVKSFWVDEFAQYNDRFRSEAINPIQNKVGQFLSSAIIRNIVGQPKSSIDLREVMDKKKILILNLAKGKVGEDNSNMLGSMLITRIQLAAMSRANVAEEERPDFYLYVDEFQNFATESFATILSEARKYRLNLIVAHQYIAQMSESVRDAIFGNVGTMIIYRVGAADAEMLEPEFAPNLTQEDIVNLEKYHVYMKLMIDGIASRPFSAITLPPLSKQYGNYDKVIQVTRERYANERLKVEEKIARWSGQDMREMAAENIPTGTATTTVGRMQEKLDRREGKAPQSAGKPQERATEAREMFNATCSECNKIFTVPFKPDGVRPVYCKDCLPEARRRQAIGEQAKVKTNTRSTNTSYMAGSAPTQGPLNTGISAQPSPQQQVQQPVLQPIVDPNTGQLVYPVYVMPPAANLQQQTTSAPVQSQTMPPAMASSVPSAVSQTVTPQSVSQPVVSQNPTAIISEALQEVAGHPLTKSGKQNAVKKVENEVELGSGELSLNAALSTKPKSFSKKKPTPKGTATKNNSQKIEPGQTVKFD